MGERAVKVPRADVFDCEAGQGRWQNFSSVNEGDSSISEPEPGAANYSPVPSLPASLRQEWDSSQETGKRSQFSRFLSICEA
jgi:hypothetical protein